MSKILTPNRTAAMLLTCFGVLFANPCSWEYTLVGTTSMKLADRTSARGSFWGSSVEVGNDAVLAGVLSAPTSLRLGDRTKVTGEIHWLGTFWTGNNVLLNTTTTQDATLLGCDIPAAPAVVTGTAVTVPNDASQELSPGTYGDVLVRARGKINLLDGNYQFTSLTLEPDTKLLWEGSDSIQISGGVSIGDRVLVQGARLAQFVIGGGLSIGTDGWIMGNWAAPNGDVHVYSRTLLQGSLLGNAVNFEPDVVVSSQTTLAPTEFDSVLVDFKGSLNWSDFLQAEFRLFHSVTDSSSAYGLSTFTYREQKIMDACLPTTDGTRVPLLTILDTLPVYNSRLSLVPIQLATLATNTVRDSVVGVYIPWGLQHLRGRYVMTCQITIGATTYTVTPLGTTWISFPADGPVHATLKITTNDGYSWSNGFDFTVNARTQGGQP